MDNRSEMTIPSPVGELHLAAGKDGLTHVLYARRESVPPRGDGSPQAGFILDRTRKQLEEFFAGARREFDLPLAPEGTDFQLSVWRALLDIPCGETTSYGELARRLGRPRAFRAVGAANGANPISIIVPCHRVIGVDRSLTGYGGGLPAKQALLELEGITLRFTRPE